MSTINNGNLEISFNSIGLSKGIGCIMKLQCDQLKGKEINIGNKNQTPSTSTLTQPWLKKSMSLMVDNGLELTHKIFWKKDCKSSESIPLPYCCEHCGQECIEFRSSCVKFSWEGKCEVPITLWCSPTHNRRPKTTVLILEIQITHNDMNVKGEIAIPFKKHTKSPTRVESEPKNPMKFQQQISILNNTVQSINRLVESLPEDKATELESLRCYASLLLIEAEKRNPRKRKMLEEEKEEETHQQKQPYQPYQPYQSYPSHQTQPSYQQQEMVNTMSTPNPPFTASPLEISHTANTTNTNTLPTYITYTPSTSTTNTLIDSTPLPFTFKIDPDCPFISRVPPEIFHLFFRED